MIWVLLYLALGTPALCVSLLFEDDVLPENGLEQMCWYLLWAPILLLAAGYAVINWIRK